LAYAISGQARLVEEHVANQGYSQTFRGGPG
jgi:hypothetical protein